MTTAKGSGFVDLQVNGAHGIDFSSRDLTAAGIAKVCQTLAQDGTIAFCPTVVTTTWDVYEKVLPLLATAIEKPGHGARPLGIHLEGPFISSLDGAVGAHRKEWVIPPTLEALERLVALARGTIALITVAPEVPGCDALIASAVKRGVKISIGHTLATGEDIERAVAAGATLATHVGNGCPQMMHRHNNPVVAQLSSPLNAMIISDGHHLPAPFLRMIAALKGPEHLVLTSDASSCAGQPPGRYNMFGTMVELMPDGMIRNLNAPGLAGAGSQLFACVNHAAKVLGWSEAQMWRIARDNPLAMLGRGSEAIAAGGPVQWRNGTFVLSPDWKPA